MTKLQHDILRILSDAGLSTNDALTATKRILSLQAMADLNSAAFMALSAPKGSREREWCDMYLGDDAREWVINGIHSGEDS